MSGSDALGTVLSQVPAARLAAGDRGRQRRPAIVDTAAAAASSASRVTDASAAGRNRRSQVLVTNLQGLRYVGSLRYALHMRAATGSSVSGWPATIALQSPVRIKNPYIT